MNLRSSGVEAKSHWSHLLAGTGGCEACEVVHEEGAKLLREWIASLPGGLSRRGEAGSASQ
ncbi:MAG TPA: hypothetical protein VGV15_03590 [Terriglobales bacterium]|nr:hypothetical protein [Terriglobales bacterium]